MLKRALVPALAAGLLSFAFPATAQAAVDETANTRYPDLNGTVLTVAHRGNTVFIGGSFTRISGPNGAFVRRGAAAFDIRNGRVLPWNPNVRGTVNDIAVAKKNVYLAGSFRRVKNKPRPNLALVSSTGKAKLSTWKVPVSGHVRTMDLAGKNLYLGGRFTAVNGVKRSKLAAIARRNGKVLKWRPSVNGDIYDVEYSTTGVYLAGAFTRVNTTNISNRLAQVTRAGTGRTVMAFDTHIDHPILDIAVTGSRVYAAEGGQFGGGVLAVERADGTTTWERRMDGDGQAITALGGLIYVGGHFSNVCPQWVTDPDNEPTPGQDENGNCDNDEAAGRLAAFTGAGEQVEWNPAMNHRIGVKALDAYGPQGRLIAGGGFTTTGTDTTNRLAVFPTR
jgi:hypothetical protein